MQPGFYLRSLSLDFLEADIQRTNRRDKAYRKLCRLSDELRGRLFLVCRNKTFLDLGDCIARFSQPLSNADNLLKKTVDRLPLVGYAGGAADRP